MLKFRSLINKYLTWNVGSGDEALFWEDSWEGKPPLSTFKIPPTLKDKLTELWGNKVKDYRTLVNSDGSLVWKWKSLQGIGLDDESI